MRALDWLSEWPGDMMEKLFPLWRGQVLCSLYAWEDLESLIQALAADSLLGRPRSATVARDLACCGYLTGYPYIESHTNHLPFKLQLAIEHGWL